MQRGGSDAVRHASCRGRARSEVMRVCILVTESDMARKPDPNDRPNCEGYVTL